MRVIFTPRAARQIDVLYDYVATRSGESRADGYVGRIIEFCRGLQTFPQRARRRDDLLPGLRLVGFERRVVIALVITDEAVVIEGIFYGGQDLSKAWQGE